jgi:hypothetical protein
LLVLTLPFQTRRGHIAERNLLPPTEAGSLRLDPGEFDRFGPFPSIVGDELAKSLAVIAFGSRLEPSRRSFTAGSAT